MLNYHNSPLSIHRKTWFSGYSVYKLYCMSVCLSLHQIVTYMAIVFWFSEFSLHTALQWINRPVLVCVYNDLPCGHNKSSELEFVYGTLLCTQYCTLCTVVNQTSVNLIWHLIDLRYWGHFWQRTQGNSPWNREWISFKFCWTVRTSV